MFIPLASTLVNVLFFSLLDMASLELLDSFNRRSVASSFAPRITPLELTVGKAYKITAFRSFQSEKYGRSVIAVLKVPERSESLHDCFLPRRFVPLLPDKEIERYNLAPDLALIFQGMGKKREYLISLEENWE